MKVFGSQIIAEFVHCDSDDLNQASALEALLSEGIQKYDLNLKSLNSFQFDPMGVTAIAIIGESHVAIHTYPEEKHASIDIFTCSPGSSGPRRLLDFLADKLKPQQVRHKTIARGNKIGVHDQDYILDFSRSCFDIRYHISKELLNRRTAYQHMRIIENENFGTLLFLDNELQVATSDAKVYNRAMVAPLVQVPHAKVAILGGGDGGVLNECLQLKGLEKAYLIDIDGEVIEAARQFLPEICGGAFEDPRAKVVVGEALSFLKEHQGFDCIVYDLTMSPEITAVHDKDAYFSALFEALHASLKPGGVLSLQVCSVHDRTTFEYTKALLERYFTQVQFTEVFVPSFCELWRFGSARRG